ncbi:alpha/beta fold hydrolase [Dactylosporangium sp. NPDC005572]|uniref:esterase/lipase family protein n=1 Tax=Dactylosporangium sp. NPDC005572 TaxID=3156889 RepID=UPI0033BDD524
MIDATLVTVHGFWSSPRTWDRLTSVWAHDERLAGLRIHHFGYPSPKAPRLPFSPTRIPDYEDIAQALANEYSVRLADAGAVVFVTHSQGRLILQRFLVWMLHEHRGRELARIASVVTLVCPNNGADYLRSLRRYLGYRRHPQAGELETLNREVADTQRAVLQDIVNASGIGEYRCRIPVHVYAGIADGVVPAASAQATFPGAGSIAGNHYSILDPESPGGSTAETVRHHLLTDLSAHNRLPPRPPNGRRPSVTVNNSRNVVVGDHNTIVQHSGRPDGDEDLR